ADVLPEIPEHRHLISGNVLSYGHARQLDDAALDGIHEREVAHGPWEERALCVPRAAQEEWGRGQVHHAADSELPTDRFQARDPDSGCLVVLLSFFPFVALENLVVWVSRLLSIAVMSLVVDDEDVLHAH